VYEISFIANPSLLPAFCTASDKSWAWRPGNEAGSKGLRLLLFNASSNVGIIGGG